MPRKASTETTTSEKKPASKSTASKSTSTTKKTTSKKSDEVKQPVEKEATTSKSSTTKKTSTKSSTSANSENSKSSTTKKTSEKTPTAAKKTSATEKKTSASEKKTSASEKKTSASEKKTSASEKKTSTKKTATKTTVEPEVTTESNLNVDEMLQNTADAIVEVVNRTQEVAMLDSFRMPNLVDPSVTLIQESDPFKKIEMAGRTCYKSEGSITKASALKFVKGLMKSQHMAMVEHAVMVFEIDCDDGFEAELMDYVQYIQKTDFMYVTLESSIPRILVSGNIRAILERMVKDPVYQALISAYPEFESEEHLLDSSFYHIRATVVDIQKMKNLTEDEFMQHFNFTCKFVTDRGVTHEMVRHRRFSFAQESTRYCNYSKDKFGNHCTFCKPATFDNWTQDQKDMYFATLSTLDEVYNYLTTGEHALQPQQARAILPNTLKTEIVITGPAFEWQHFFNLRSRGTTGAPHPDIKIVADEALEKMNSYLETLKFENKLQF